MLIRSDKPVQTSTENRSVASDLSKVFQAPAEYLNGARKRIKGVHNDNWWLNVDYVIAEVPA